MEQEPNASFSWQQQIKNSYKTTEALRQDGYVPQSLGLSRENADFQVTPYYASLFNKKDLTNCPIYRQAVPNHAEIDPEDLPDWAVAWSQRLYGRDAPWDEDPIGDKIHALAPRLTHRYQHRLIVHVSAVCAVYCRFCFRKNHLQQQDKTLYSGSLEATWDYIRANKQITEVILTGGDPLSLGDERLKQIMDTLEKISHVEVVRLHSRMLVTLPMRLSPILLAILTQRRFSSVLVSHFNHPQELTSQALKALTDCKKAGVLLYNQTVLLRNINNQLPILYHLFQSLYNAGVKPFYLHHCDWTKQTFGFRVSIQEGLTLQQQLIGLLSGPALPHYVLDIPHGYGKIHLSSSACQLIGSKQGITSTGQRLGGDLYEVRLPHTRTQQQKDNGLTQYMDLYFMDTSH